MPRKNIIGNPDSGKTILVVYVYNDLIKLEFDKPIQAVEMNPNHAIDIANAIIEKAKELLS